MATSGILGGAGPLGWPAGSVGLTRVSAALGLSGGRDGSPEGPFGGRDEKRGLSPSTPEGLPPAVSGASLPGTKLPTRQVEGAGLQRRTGASRPAAMLCARKTLQGSGGQNVASGCPGRMGLGPPKVEIDLVQGFGEINRKGHRWPDIIISQTLSDWGLKYSLIFIFNKVDFYPTFIISLNRSRQ